MFDDLKIGILGGGQLGAMLLRYAIDYGFDVSVMDKDPKAPCARYRSSFVTGDPMNYDDVVKFGQHLDIVTIEREATNIAALKALRDRGVKVYPSPETLEIIQDKYVQKEFLKEHNIPVAMGWLVMGKAEMASHTDKLPEALKKYTNSYDSKGVLVLRTAEDLGKAFNASSILEEIVDIKQEISVIVSRNESGVVECYDPVLMMFDKERMLLDLQICPAGLDQDIAIRACSIATKVAEAIALTGIMAVEMFIANNGKIYVNELATRPHNGGHHTVETTKTPWFEQQMRVILGLPTGSTQTTTPSAMLNILEPAAHKRNAVMEALKTILCTNDVHLHWYRKTGYTEGRKMGNVTVTDVQREDAISKSIMIKHLLKECHA